MAQQVKMLATKPNHLSLISGFHTVERATAHVCTHAYTYNKCNLKNLLGVVAHTCNPRTEEAETEMSPTCSRAVSTV